MTTIKRSELQTALKNKEVNVADLKASSSVPAEVKARVDGADVNGDGVIAGKAEVDRLFDVADRFDTDGNRNTVRGARGNQLTAAGGTLVAAVNVATPRRGLQGNGGTGGTAPTDAAPSASGTGRTTLDDSYRRFREVDVDKLRDQLPAQAKHLADDFVAAGRRHNVDPLLLVSISKHETANWTSSAFRNKNNAMGISNSRGPTRQPSAEASIDKMASLLGSKTSGPYQNASSYRELWGIYAPGPATGQGRQSNDPGNLNRHWGPNIIKNIDMYSAALR
jgi:hypothetical protein